MIIRLHGTPSDSVGFVPVMCAAYPPGRRNKNIGSDRRTRLIPPERSHYEKLVFRSVRSNADTFLVPSFYPGTTALPPPPPHHVILYIVRAISIILYKSQGSRGICGTLCANNAFRILRSKNPICRIIATGRPRDLFEKFISFPTLPRRRISTQCRAGLI